MENAAQRYRLCDETGISLNNELFDKLAATYAL